MVSEFLVVLLVFVEHLFVVGFLEVGVALSPTPDVAEPQDNLGADLQEKVVLVPVPVGEQLDQLVELGRPAGLEHIGDQGNHLEDLDQMGPVSGDLV